MSENQREDTTSPIPTTPNQIITNDNNMNINIMLENRRQRLYTTYRLFLFLLTIISLISIILASLCKMNEIMTSLYLITVQSIIFVVSIVDFVIRCSGYYHKLPKTVRNIYFQITVISNMFILSITSGAINIAMFNYDAYLLAFAAILALINSMILFSILLSFIVRLMRQSDNSIILTQDPF